MTSEWPKHHIDHINGDGLDNRWFNLREATHHQNCANSRISRANTSGFKGVEKYGRKWKASIRVNRKPIYLGMFAAPGAAHAAYVAAAEKYFGEFARAA